MIRKSDVRWWVLEVRKHPEAAESIIEELAKRLIELDIQNEGLRDEIIQLQRQSQAPIETEAAERLRRQVSTLQQQIRDTNTHTPSVVLLTDTFEACRIPVSRAVQLARDGHVIPQDQLSSRPRHMIYAQPGDQLILTKPLGTGIINTAIKAGMADDQSIEEVTAIMAMLNKQAAELMQETVVHAATDVTGFGFLGHACEMIQNKDIGFEINHAAIPILSHAVEFAQMGLIPAGAYRNRDFRSSMVDFHQDVPVWASDILFDPQTSGGLLIAVPENDAAILVEHLRQAGYSHSVVIGKAANSRPGMIFVV